MNRSPGGGAVRLGVALAVASLALVAFGTNTIPQANKMAYDAYNNETAAPTVTVTGIVVSQPKFYDSTLGTPLAQAGVSFGALVIQDPTATRTIGNTTYSNGIKVLFGSNYGTIPAGTPFPLSLADRQNYHFPQEGDMVTITGLATISYGTVSAILPLTIGDEPVIDLRDTSTYPMMTIVSENNFVNPTPVTLATFTVDPYFRFNNSAVVGLVDLHSRKGQAGFLHGNLTPNPMLGMEVTCPGLKFDQLNPKNVQQSYNNGPVGLMLASTDATNFPFDSTIFVNCRPSLGTGETTNPINAGLTSAGGTIPVTGVVCSHLLLVGDSMWNATGIQARYQDDITDASGGGNRVTFTTINQAASVPIVGGQVDVTLNTLETGSDLGHGTAKVDLGIMGVGGALDVNTHNPISSLVLTNNPVGSNTYKGSFVIGAPAGKGYLPPSISYVNTGTSVFLNSSSLFSPVLNAVPFKSLAALKAVMLGLPDGYPVAISSTFPGTVLPIVTAEENDFCANLGTTSEFWVQDPLEPAGQCIYMPDGNRSTPLVHRGDAVSIAGTLQTFHANREVQGNRALQTVASSNNPIPAATLMNTNNVSEEWQDPLNIQRPPASLAPTQGVLVTVYGKVTASPSTTLVGNTSKGYVDIDDGTGPIPIVIRTGVGAGSPGYLADMLKVGDTVMATGVCSANTTFSGPSANIRTLWIRSASDVLKAPSTTTVSVSATAGGLVTLPAPISPGLQNTPAVLAALGPQRLYNGTYYSGAAGSNPWPMGLDFLQLGESYKAAASGTVNYAGLTAGTGTDYTATQQSFDLSTLCRFYALFDTPGSTQLAGISYNTNTVLWDADGPANAFWGFKDSAFESTFGAPATTLAGLVDGAGNAITSPHTFAAGEAFQTTTKTTGDAVYLQPQAATVTGSLKIQVLLPVSFKGVPNGYPVDVQVRYPGSLTPVISFSGALDASSSITVPNVLGGMYDAWVKPCGMLSSKATSVAVPVGGIGVAVVDGPNHFGVLSGDSHVDNAVNLLDLSNILSKFTKPATCPDDTNGDGIINLADLSTILANFNQHGVP